MKLPEREMVGWTYNQLKSTSKSETELCATYQEELNGSPDELVDFLRGSKYFRKTGDGSAVLRATYLATVSR